MQLKTAQIAGFLQSPPKSVRVILVYGPDTGLVCERIEGLASKLVADKNDPFSVSALTGQQINSEPSRLYDEASALSLTGGRRLIRVQQALESNAKTLEAFINNPPATDSVILIEGGDLDKKSKLRSLCEGSSDLTAGIPCYLEDAVGRQKTIAGMLQSENLTASRDVIRLLADILPPDRLALRSEMDKLALYAKGQKEVSLDDVRTIIADAGGAEADDLIQAAVGGDIKRTATLLDHLFAEQVSPVTLFRAFQRHMMRLQIARAHMANGANAAEALKKLSPPVFWKNVEPMTRQLSRWSLERIELRLQQSLQAEAAVKRTGTPDLALCSHFFLGIAAKA